MNCSDARPHLAEFADGQPPPEQRPALEQHVSSCPTCRELVSRWYSLRKVTSRVLLMQAVPSGLESRIQGQLQVATRHRRRLFLTYGGVSLAAAAVLLVVGLRYAGVLNWWAPPQPQLLIAALPADAVVRVHQKCALGHAPHDGLHVKDQCPKVQSGELSKKLQFAVHLPDLSDQGYKLKGACMCLKVAQAHAIHAVYSNEQNPADTISFFYIDRRCELKNGKTHRCRQEKPDSPQFVAVPVNGTMILAWDAASATCVVCAEKDEDSLRSLATSAKLALADHRSDFLASNP